MLRHALSLPWNGGMGRNKISPAAQRVAKAQAAKVKAVVI
jgi:hypothetical protein